MSENHQFVFGIVIAILALPLLPLFVRLVRVQVEDGEVVLLTRFGRLAATLSRPGWHWLPDRALPWVGVRRVSMRRDYREIRGIQVNDVRGTTLVVDVWLEFRIADPVKASFEVADFDQSLQNVAAHAVISILGDRELSQILSDRTELAQVLRRDIRAETTRWGLEVELVFLKNVSLLPEVAQQLFQSVAARLERAKADIEEDGRQKVALLGAQTSVQIAALVGAARGQYPLAIARAYKQLGENPEVLAAYRELYELSLARPDQMVAFKGFGAELRAVDAAMLPPPG